MKRVTFGMRAEIHIHLHVKYPLLLSDFNENLEYLGKDYQNSSLINFMKILKLSHAHRVTASHGADYVRISATVRCERDKKDKMGEEEKETDNEQRRITRIT
jgi:hypothetical protein